LRPKPAAYKLKNEVKTVAEDGETNVEIDESKSGVETSPSLALPRSGAGMAESFDVYVFLDGFRVSEERLL